MEYFNSQIFKEKITEKICSIIILIFILFLCLSILFIYIISNKASSIFKNKIENLISEKIYNFLIDSSSTEKEVFIKKIAGIINSNQKINILNKNNPSTNCNNTTNKMIIKIVLIFLFIFFILILFIIKFIFSYNINFKEILIENFIFFSLFGLFEYLFYILVISNYISITPSFVTKCSLDTIRKNL